jgi:hypothetical protein
MSVGRGIVGMTILAKESVLWIPSIVIEIVFAGICDQSQTLRNSWALCCVAGFPRSAAR